MDNETLKSTIEEIEERLEEIEDELIDVNNAYNYEDQYCCFLDENYPIEIGNCNYLMASEVLRKFDPVAYRTGLNDFADALINDDIAKLEAERDDLLSDLDYYKEELEEATE